MSYQIFIEVNSITDPKSLWDTELLISIMNDNHPVDVIQQTGKYQELYYEHIEVLCDIWQGKYSAQGNTINFTAYKDGLLEHKYRYDAQQYRLFPFTPVRTYWHPTQIN